ncbi:hypothetical protein N7478_012012 [Penicillium angulare]|uniref:uncharacterized protein n=1 Tax=Penicillium angulare TaxID=116970 RepID=UPI002541529D|nr:uncharacterized protein N7478_012012 [Penicillium angulare]KAJ5261417.1 hypothetical protein N7478_012012 [Penicillium angulare]
MQFSIKTIGLISLYAMTVSAASKFAQTCENVETFGNTLRASCREFENGELRPSTLNLNECIKNGKGSLKCGKNGDFQGSCINCSLRGSTELYCMCRNVQEGHRFVPTHIDLSKFHSSKLE